MKTETTAINIDRGKGDFFYPEAHVRDAGTGLSERTIHYIADVKEDPDWVREFRLRGLKTFLEKPLPTHWASKDLEAIDFDKIRYYLSPGTEAKRSWDEVPDDIKRTLTTGYSGAGTKIPRWRRSAVRQRSCLFKHQESRRRTRGHFRWLDRRTETLSGDFQAMVQQSHSGWRQQVQCAEFSCVQWRLIHIRPTRRESEASAAGILSHQRGKFRPIRAHAHHCR